MTITSTLWPLEPHTRGKHLVLKSYLEVWFPKLGFQNQRILFIDGFAGPGEYERGEKGSPLIALDTFLEHSAREAIGSAANFVFIERDQRRCRHLRSLVESYRTRLPSGWTIEVICAAF